jgi:hypothetical protein
MDWLNLIVTTVVSAVVSALVSLLFGPLRAKWEDAARRDLAVHREISRHLRELILLLRRDLSNRKIRKSGGSPSFNEFLEIWDVEKVVWRIVQALDSPDLNRKDRDWLLNELKGLAGPTIDVLQTCPSESMIGQDSEASRASFIQYASRSHGSQRFPLDHPFVGDERYNPCPMGDLVQRVERLYDCWERRADGPGFLRELADRLTRMR